MLRSSAGGGRRAGQVLVLVAILLPALCGMVGLVVDAGVMLAAHRQAQNAADAAARAAALKRAAGGSNAAALAAAQAYVESYNQLPGAAVTLNSPPLSGNYAGNPAYVEVVVTVQTDAWFIPVVGGDSHPTVAARAVAGSEAKAAPEALCILDPGAVPGLTIDGTQLRVNGRVGVNSQGAGYDEAGGWVGLGSPPYGVQGLNGGTFQGDQLRTVGGVDSAAGYVTAAGVPCLNARQLPRSDPLLALLTPTTASGVVQTYPGVDGQTFASPQDVAAAPAAGQTVTLSPGIYRSIVVGGSGAVTFQPGIYVLKGGNTDGRALSITTTGAVTGNGVVFYNTGSTYDPVTGAPDRDDGNVLGTDPAATFGDVTLDAGDLNLVPLAGPASSFAGFVLYQRRWNPRPITVHHNSSDDALVGTVYARWAQVTLAKPGTVTAQFVVGSFAATSATPGGVITVNPSPVKGRARLVFLVE